MSGSISRRAALQHLGTGAGILVTGGILRGQSRPIRVAAAPVEIIVSSISPSTVRITAVALDSADADLPEDGALVPEAEVRPLARERDGESFAPIRAGNLVVRFTRDPP